LIAFPGGFGTLDELMEILTLVQTHKLSRDIPVILYGASYWKEIVNFEALRRHGMIDGADLELFQFADEPAAAFAIIKDRLAAARAGPLARGADLNWSAPWSGQTPLDIAERATRTDIVGWLAGKGAIRGNSDRGSR
jgi:hypothetical protein